MTLPKNFQNPYLHALKLLFKLFKVKVVISAKLNLLG